MKVPDPYKTLNLPHSATLEQVKRSYRELARKCHPDRLTLASEQEKEEATFQFAKISAAYALLTDPQRKAQYDHIYKYGGYDDDDDEDEMKMDEHNRRQATSSSTAPQSSSQPNSSRKRKCSTGVGYACADPLAYIWTNGKVQTKMAVAGIQIPSRLSQQSGLRFAFSSGQFSQSPTGTQTFTTSTTQFVHGKKVTRTETTVVHPDGRKEVLEGIDANGAAQKSKERNCYSSQGEENNQEHMAMTGESKEPWYVHAWFTFREKLSMCYNPCVVAVR